MKEDIPKPLIILAVALVVIGVGFAFWKFSQPLEPDIKLPDTTKMSREEIQRLKQGEHDADASRAQRR